MEKVDLLLKVETEQAGVLEEGSPAGNCAIECGNRRSLLKCSSAHWFFPPVLTNLSVSVAHQLISMCKTLNLILNTWTRGEVGKVRITKIRGDGILLYI